MSKIDLENCNHLKFLHKNTLYTIKGCSDIKNFALNVSEQDFTIYDEYGAPLYRRIEKLLINIQNDGTHSKIKEYVLENCPEVCL
jgi:hypothetical protein